jgi:hypothetical protein
MLVQLTDRVIHDLANQGTSRHQIGDRQRFALFKAAHDIQRQGERLAGGSRGRNTYRGTALQGAASLRDVFVRILPLFRDPLTDGFGVNVTAAG